MRAEDRERAVVEVTARMVAQAERAAREGQGPGLEIETATKTIQPGERLALVTAGVWRTAPPASAISSGTFPTTAEAVRQLVGQARLNGGREDTTAIVIAVRRSDEDPEPEH